MIGVYCCDNRQAVWRQAQGAASQVPSAVINVPGINTNIGLNYHRHRPRAILFLLLSGVRVPGYWKALYTVLTSELVRTYWGGGVTS